MWCGAEGTHLDCRAGHCHRGDQLIHTRNMKRCDRKTTTRPRRSTSKRSTQTHGTRVSVPIPLFFANLSYPGTAHHRPFGDQCRTVCPTYVQYSPLGVQDPVFLVGGGNASNFIVDVSTSTLREAGAVTEEREWPTAAPVPGPGVPCFFSSLRACQRYDPKKRRRQGWVGCPHSHGGAASTPPTPPALHTPLPLPSGVARWYRTGRSGASLPPTFRPPTMRAPRALPLCPVHVRPQWHPLRSR